MNVAAELNCLLMRCETLNNILTTCLHVLLYVHLPRLECVLETLRVTLDRSIYLIRHDVEVYCERLVDAIKGFYRFVKLNQIIYSNWGFVSYNLLLSKVYLYFR